MNLGGWEFWWSFLLYLLLVVTIFFSAVLKKGVPQDEELERLGRDIADQWPFLGRLLNVERPKIRGIDKDFDSLHEKGFQMLIHWKQKNGSDASYKVLSDALKDDILDRKDLAETYCYE